MNEQQAHTFAGDIVPSVSITNLVNQRQAVLERTTRSADLEYFTVKWFYNGNGHVTFKRLDLVERMNEIIARHYPGALPYNRRAA